MELKQEKLGFYKKHSIQVIMKLQEESITSVNKIADTPNLCCHTTAEFVVVLQYVKKMPPVRKPMCRMLPWPWKNKLTHNCWASFA